MRTRVAVLDPGDPVDPEALSDGAGAPGAGDGAFRIEEVDLPDPAGHRVLVRVVASGVCQSQLNRLRRPRATPILLGHEATGVVEAIGPDATTVRPGDRVLLTWMPNPAAHGGRRPEPTRLTTGSGETAAENLFTWAGHTLVDEQFLHPLPDDADPVAAAVVGCAVMTGAGAVRATSPVTAGESVAVIGTGGVGLCAVAAAAVLGADPVIAVDLSPDNRRLAREFGATHVVDPAAEDPVAAVRALTTRAGEVDYRRQPVAGADHVHDFVASPATLRQALAATRPGALGVGVGGTAVLVGTPHGGWDLDAVDLLLGEKRVAASMGGSCVPDRDLPVYLDWLASGRLPLERLVTRRIGLDDAGATMAAMARGEISGRAVITF